METIVQWELGLLHAIQEAATEWGNVLWSAVTMIGEAGIFWIVTALVLMFFPKTRKMGFTMGAALLLGVIFGNGVLKNLFARPRPYDLDPTLAHRLQWVEMSGDFSFPSGHTLACFEGATSVFLYHRKWGLAAYALAFTVMLSRLFLLVHYPTDLLAGALLGTLFAFLGSLLVKALWKRFAKAA